MGKTMPKSTVIYGQQHAVRVATFSGSNLADIINLVKDKVGPEVKINQGAITKAVNDAKAHKKMKDAYVKVGVIDGDLILRCKEKKFFGDIEIDVVLVKGYKPKASKYELVKIEQQMAEIERAKAAQEKLAQRQRVPRMRAMQQEREDKADLERQQTVQPQPSGPQASQPPVVEQQAPTREERLRKVMNTPDSQGETMREKLLRAAEKGKKLGVGKGTQERLAAQGLHPMDERYHGEVLDDQKNRYGRHLAPLKKVWDEEPSVGMNFSRWLDEVEKGNTSVPGVAKARTLKNSDTGGLIVEPGGTAGGTMVYLDEVARKPYEARVSRGSISGTHVSGSGEFIFVIGPDNKVYAGQKARAQAGKRGAFNHSSFFSGAPVKSAGTLTVAGGQITKLSDLSGHYTPTPSMVLAAIRKLGGQDKEWLDKVRIIISNKDAGSGTEFLAGEAQKRQAETWGKYSHGGKTSAWTEKVLMDGDDGSWLVRENRTGQLMVSSRKGDAVSHKPIGELGTLGLDRKQLIVPGKLPTPKTQPSSTPAPQKPPVQPPPSTTLNKPDIEAQLRLSPAFHGSLNRVGAEALLLGKPDGSWLLREGTGKLIVFSRVNEGKPEHAQITSETDQQNVIAYMQRFARRAVKP